MLKDLLEKREGTCAEFNQAVKRCFEPYTPPIEVDGYELECVIILTNLASRAAEILDDRASAKSSLATETFWKKVRQSAQQFHTHNLKFPDARVHFKNRIRIINSQKQLPVFGWSGNSSDYNFARFLNSAFQWQNQRHTLLTVVLDDQPAWRNAFSRLGVFKEQWLQIREQLKQTFQTSTLPSTVDIYSPQLRLPWRGSHLIAITPVANHEVQLQIQSKANELPSIRISYPRPAAIGQLCGALGGNINYLHYQPIPHGLIDFQTRVSTEKTSLLTSRSLTGKHPESVYRSLINRNISASLRQSRIARRDALRQFDSILESWLNALMDVRQHFLETGNLAYENLNTIEKSFVRDEVSSKDLRKHLNKVFHQSLQLYSYTQDFAYHPSLASTLDQRLKQLLSHENHPPPPDEQPELGYVALHNLSIADGNALNNPYCAGMPSMTGLWGFCKNLEIQLKESGFAVSVRRVALMSHEFAANRSILLAEPSRPSPQKDSQTVKRSGLLPKFTFSGQFSVVIEYRKSAGRLSELTADDLRNHLPDRLWSGSLTLQEAENNHGVHLTDDFDLLYRKLVRQFRRGVWLIPDSSEVTEQNSLFDLLHEDKKRAPLLTGFKALEEPKIREGALCGLHFYAEPAIGICRRETMFRLTKSPDYFLNKAFWGLAPATNNDESIHLVRRV